MTGRWLRRIRYGAPIVVVSGLPRSGTSMMMRMLEAGGVRPLDDGIRAADISNPKGYFEFEPVKDLEAARGDVPWLPEARGKAVKIISFLLTWLPEDFNYQVIFMQRDLDEVLASQQQMLARRGESGTGTSREVFEAHLAQVERFMAARPCFETLHVPYREAVAAPEATAAAVARFLGRPMDTSAMAKAVEASLYRNRA
ncbi:MAG: sulfotransferase family protein [Acidobacteria bacterium]|nr:sulfotransferase family protein [Acidobacteriota bacterium]